MPKDMISQHEDHMEPYQSSISGVGGRMMVSNSMSEARCAIIMRRHITCLRYTSTPRGATLFVCLQQCCDGQTARRKVYIWALNKPGKDITSCCTENYFICRNTTIGSTRIHTTCYVRPRTWRAKPLYHTVSHYSEPHVLSLLEHC